VSMPFWAYDTIKKLSSDATNSTFTKGIVAYEALLVSNDKYEDSFSQIEAQIEADLSDVVGVDISENINKIKFADTDEAITNRAKSVTDGDPYTTAEQVNLHLPVSLCEQFEGRGLGQEVARGVAHIEAAPWSSRMERAEVKRQLLTYARGDRVEEPHEFVEAVMEGDTSRWDISDLVSAFKYDNRWEDPDITFDELEEVALEIPQTWRKRVPALQKAVSNVDGSITESEVVDWVMANMGVATRSTAQNYVDKIDFGKSDGIVVDWVTDTMQERAKHIRDDMDDDHQMQSKSDHELLGLHESVYDIDGVYASVEEAENAIDTISAENRTSRKITEQQSQYFKIIRAKLDFVEA